MWRHISRVLSFGLLGLPRPIEQSRQPAASLKKASDPCSAPSLSLTLLEEALGRLVVRQGVDHGRSGCPASSAPHRRRRAVQVSAPRCGRPLLGLPALSEADQALADQSAMQTGRHGPRLPSRLPPPPPERSSASSAPALCSRPVAQLTPLAHPLYAGRAPRRRMCGS